MNKHTPIVNELIDLLEERTDLAEALVAAISKAARPNLADLQQYLEFLDQTVTLIPTDRNLNPVVLQFYYLLAQSPEDLLLRDTEFQDWTRTFAQNWGAFLDTVESSRGIRSFFTNPAYHIDDYYVAPSGWLTFNQFFARQVRPGKRPVTGWNDDRIIVSPADSVYQGQWPIQDDSCIRVKGFTWSVLELLAGSPFQDRFRGGLFTHSFLNINDYHRYHVPVGGVIREARKIPGKVTMDVIQKPDGSLDIVDGTGFQFSQDRGLIVIESPVGLVAVLPIGMAQVSSVTLTAQEGVTLTKGEEFGFFQFGGSDIVMLFEAGRVSFDATIGTHYNQGQQIGHALAL